MRLGEIMTKDVATAAPTTSVEEAAQLMADIDVGFLPVCEGSRLVGVITDRDIVTRVTAEGRDPKAAVVRDYMSPDPVTASPDTPISEAARVMAEYQIRRLPVLQGERLVGVVSLGDLAVDAGDECLAGETLEQISEPAEPEIFPEAAAGA